MSPNRSINISSNMNESLDPIAEKCLHLQTLRPVAWFFADLFILSLSQETATEASNNQQDTSNGICVYAVSNSLWNKVKPHCLRFLLKVFEGSFLEFCFILSL